MVVPLGATTFQVTMPPPEAMRATTIEHGVLSEKASGSVPNAESAAFVNWGIARKPPRLVRASRLPMRYPVIA